MAYTSVAQFSFDARGASWTVDFEVSGAASASNTFRMVWDKNGQEVPQTRRLGTEKIHPFNPILPAVLETTIWDESRTIHDYIEANKDDDIAITVKKGGTIWHTGFLDRVKGGDRVDHSNPALRLVWNDGLPRLKNIDFDKQGRDTLLDALFHVIDQAGLGLPVRVALAWKHQNTDLTTSPANRRSLAWQIDFANQVESGSYWDVLSQLLRHYNLQIFQEDGRWYVLHRSYRGGSYDWEELSSQTGSVSTGSTSPVVTVANSDWRGKGSAGSGDPVRRPPIPPQGWAQNYGLMRGSRWQNEDFTSDSTSPFDQDMPTGWWLYGGQNVNHDRANDDVEVFSGGGIDTSDPAYAEQLLNEIVVADNGNSTYDQFQIRVKGEFDVLSTGETGTVDVPVLQVMARQGEPTVLHSVNEQGTWSTSSGPFAGDVTYVKIQDVPENNSGTTNVETFDQTFTFEAPSLDTGVEEYFIQVRLITQADPDGDTNNEINATRFQVVHVKNFKRNVTDDQRPRRGITYRASSVGNVKAEPSEIGSVEQFATKVGFRQTASNPSAGIRYYDDTLGRWELLDHEFVAHASRTFNNNSLGRARLEDRFDQHQRKMSRIIGYLPVTALNFRDSVDYDGDTWTPNFVEERIRKPDRKVGIAQLRSDGVPSGTVEVAEGEDAKTDTGTVTDSPTTTPGGSGGGGTGEESTSSSGSALKLDLGDDGTNESQDLTKIRTTNDQDNVVTEPTADELLIDFSLVNAQVQTKKNGTNVLDDPDVLNFASGAFDYTNPSGRTGKLAVPSQLDHLTDVDTAAQADGNVIASGGANYREESISSLTEAHVALADLSDVGTTSATDGHVLASDGTDFDSEAITSVTGAHVSLSDLSDVGTTSATNGHVIASDGTDFDSEAISSLTEAHVNLANLKDVDTTVGNSQLTNDSVTVSTSSPLSGGGSPTLGGTGITLSLSIDQGLTTDVDGNLEVDAGNALTFNTGTLAVAASGIGSNEIATGAVGSNEIASGAVGSTEIASGAVGSTELSSNAVGTTELDESAAFSFSSLIDLAGGATYGLLSSDPTVNTESALWGSDGTGTGNDGDVILASEDSANSGLKNITLFDYSAGGIPASAIDDGVGSGLNADDLDGNGATHYESYLRVIDDSSTSHDFSGRPDGGSAYETSDGQRQALTITSGSDISAAFNASKDLVISFTGSTGMTSWTITDDDTDSDTISDGEDVSIIGDSTIETNLSSLNPAEMTISVAPNSIGTGQVDSNIAVTNSNEVFNGRVRFVPVDGNVGVDNTTAAVEYGSGPRTSAGNGIARNISGDTSDLREYLQGGHGRFAMVWNAYWDNANTQWESAVASEPHTLVGLGNTSPGGTNGENFVVATAGTNASAGDAITWNIALMAEGGQVRFGDATTPSHDVHAAGDVAADGTVRDLSDARVKDVSGRITSALERITPGYFYTRTDKEDNSRRAGLLAQEVEETFPEAVDERGRYKTLSYTALHGLSFSAIVELREENRRLRKRIEALEG